VSATTTILRRQRDVNELLRDTIALGLANWRVLALASFAVIAPVELIAFGFGLSWFTSRFETDSLGSSIVQLGVSYLVIAPLVFGVVINTLLQAEEGERPSARVALRAAFDAFSPLLTIATVTAVAIFAGTFALVVPGIILAVRLGLVLPVAMIERPPGLQALRRAFALTARSFWSTFGRLLTIGIAAALPGYLVQAIFDAIAKSADAEAIHLAGSIVSDPLTLVSAAIATTLLYFDLVERAAVAAAAAEAAAAAAAVAAADADAPPLP
jgi:hypothetical protein